MIFWKMWMSFINRNRKKFSNSVFEVCFRSRAQSWTSWKVFLWFVVYCRVYYEVYDKLLLRLSLWICSSVFLLRKIIWNFFVLITKPSTSYFLYWMHCADKLCSKKNSDKRTPRIEKKPTERSFRRNKVWT